jgi:hypothetical protein
VSRFANQTNPKEIDQMTTVRKLLEAKETAKNFSVEASQTVLGFYLSSMVF